jgi:hypothetical protein
VTGSAAYNVGLPTARRFHRQGLQVMTKATCHGHFHSISTEDALAVHAAVLG